MVTQNGADFSATGWDGQERRERGDGRCLFPRAGEPADVAAKIVNCITGVIWAPMCC